MESVLLAAAGGAAVLLFGHGVLIVVYASVQARGPHAAVRRRLARYVAGGE